MDTADVVLHKPSGEKWLVAFVSGENIVCCGWPESMAKVSDCVLDTAATPEQRRTLLESMAGMSGYDSRKSYAKHRLAKDAAPAPSQLEQNMEAVKLLID